MHAKMQKCKNEKIQKMQKCKNEKKQKHKIIQDYI